MGRKPKKIKFIVFGQGRTGSTLLTKLLNQHPEIFCDKEIFGNLRSPKFLFPRHYMESNSRKPKTDGFNIYGFKVKIYQLFTDQQIPNVKVLLDKLNKKGWKFIFLYREDELSHNVSAVKAFSMGKWFVEQSDNSTEEEEKKLYVDPVQFKKSVLWRRKFAIMEKECLVDIPHIEVSYESDLLDSKNHQLVCDRIFDFLGIPTIQVEADIKKMNSLDLEQTIENFNEINEIYKGL